MPAAARPALRQSFFWFLAMAALPRLNFAGTHRIAVPIVPLILACPMHIPRPGGAFAGVRGRAYAFDLKCLMTV